MSWDGGKLEYLFEPELAQAAVRDMAEDGGDWLLERVIANTPVGFHNTSFALQGHEPTRTPGTLKRSWRRRPYATRVVQRGTTGMSLEVYTEDPIAPYVEDDTRPHIIRPKNPNGLLVFRAWPTGELVRAKIVRHPGTTGQHMMLTAVNAARLEFDRIVDRPLQDWARMAVRHAMQRNRGRSGLVGAY